MEKIIKINNKELKLRLSVFTIINYKSTFGTDLFSDVSKMNFKNNDDISNMTSVITTLFQIIYILHKPYTEKSFNEFLNDFDFSVITDVETLKTISDVIAELLSSNTNKTQTP